MQRSAVWRLRLLDWKMRFWPSLLPTLRVPAPGRIEFLTERVTPRRLYGYRSYRTAPAIPGLSLLCPRLKTGNPLRIPENAAAASFFALSDRLPGYVLSALRGGQ